jgi:hypothetical protein
MYLGIRTWEKTVYRTIGQSGLGFGRLLSYDATLAPFTADQRWHKATSFTTPLTCPGFPHLVKFSGKKQVSLRNVDRGALHSISNQTL